MSLSSSESDRFSTSGEEGPLGDHVGGLHEQHVLLVGEVRDVYELIESDPRRGRSHEEEPVEESRVSI